MSELKETPSMYWCNCGHHYDMHPAYCNYNPDYAPLWMNNYERGPSHTSCRVKGCDCGKFFACEKFWIENGYDAVTKCPDCDEEFRFTSDYINHWMGYHSNQQQK